MRDQFVGFPPEGIAFLTGLTHNNTKSYFDEHRETYQHDLAAPMRTFVVDVAETLRCTIAPGIEADPTVGKSLFRINRDTRFSKDKTPYHPWLDAIWWEGHDDARRAPAFIFRLAAEHLVLGAGVMGLRDEQLDRYRVAVAANASGTALQNAIVDLAATTPAAQITKPTRKRVPAPHPDDHPRRDLLRLDALHASITRPHPTEIATPDFITWIAQQLAPFAPIRQWLVEHLR